MRSLALKLMVAAAAFVTISCSAGQVPDQITTTPADPVTAAVQASLDEFKLDEAWREVGRIDVGDAVIIAVAMDSATHNTAGYHTLDEAMAAKLVTVSETSGGDVNTLVVTNNGSKPVFLMVGDLLLGGDQDRVVAESLLVDAGATDVRVPVFCVEAGRWGTNAADGELSAMRQFRNTAEVGQVSLNVKAAAVAGRSQSAVWDEVAQTNQTVGTASGNSTGTYRAVANQEQLRTQVEAALDRANQKLAAEACGFAVVVNGEVVALDLFDSAELCQKLRDKLLRGYLVSAVNGEMVWNGSREQGAGGAAESTQTITLSNQADVVLNGQVQTLEHRPTSQSRINQVQTATFTASGSPNTAIGFGAPTRTTPTSTTNNTRTVSGNAVLIESRDSGNSRPVHRCMVRQ